MHACQGKLSLTSVLFQDILCYTGVYDFTEQI